MTASVAARRCVAVGALVAVSAGVAALPAAPGRASSLSVKLIYPPDGAKVAIDPHVLPIIKLTYRVTGSCKLGEPLIDPYWRLKGARHWGGTGTSNEHWANFYDPLPGFGGRIHAFQWIVHAVCGEDVRTGADRYPHSGKGVDSPIRTFYVVQKPTS